MDLDQIGETSLSTNETVNSDEIKDVHPDDEKGTKNASETLDEFQECAICLEIIYQKDMISLHNYDSTHACTHIYHEACIEMVNIRWCPLCRRPFSSWKLCFPSSKPPEDTKDVSKSTSSKPIATATVARSTSVVSPRLPPGRAIDRPRIDAERVRLNARLNYRPSTSAVTWRSARNHGNTVSSLFTLPDSPAGRPAIVSRRSQHPPPPQTVRTAPPLPPQPPLLSSSLTGLPSPSAAIVYPLQLLKSPTLPAGVDPKRLESYLSADDFQSTFKMSRDMFARLSKGQKIVLRRQNGLHR